MEPPRPHGEGSAQSRANLYAKPFASHETAVELVLLAAGHEGGALLEPERLLEDKRR